MANRNHLSKLKKGVEAWNEWRSDNPSVPIDLSGAKLSGIDLSHRNPLISDAVYSRFDGEEVLGETLIERDAYPYANFRDADLTGADLKFARLAGADFRNANISQPCRFNQRRPQLRQCNGSEP